MKLICAFVSGTSSAAIQRVLWWMLAVSLALIISGSLQRLEALGL